MKGVPSLEEGTGMGADEEACCWGVPSRAEDDGKGGGGGRCVDDPDGTNAVSAGA